jgi:hypothetical protein
MFWPWCGRSDAALAAACRASITTWRERLNPKRRLKRVGWSMSAQRDAGAVPLGWLTWSVRGAYRLAQVLGAKQCDRFRAAVPLP